MLLKIQAQYTVQPYPCRLLCCCQIIMFYLLWSGVSTFSPLYRSVHRLVPRVYKLLLAHKASSNELTPFPVAGNYNRNGDECYINNQENQTRHTQIYDILCYRW